MSDQAFWSKSQVHWFYFKFTNSISGFAFLFFVIKSKFGCQFMCDQKWSLILKTSCITPWFQWILIFMTFLHLKSDSDDEEDH